MACCTVLTGQIPTTVMASLSSTRGFSNSGVGFVRGTLAKVEAVHQPVAQKVLAKVCKTRPVANRRSRSFLGGAGLFSPQQTNAHFLPEAGRGNSRTVCLFGRGRKRTPEYEAYEEPPEDRQQPAVVERRDEDFYTPMVEQAVRSPINYALQYPSAAAVVAAFFCAGFVVLLVKVVNHLRGGILQAALQKRQQLAFVGPEEEAALLLNARAKLAQAFGDAEHGGEVTRLEVASMMDSAADYLYALAHEVVEMKAVLSDREEKLALAVERTKQDADERKELIRRISMAEAELVEEQLKQAADKAAAAARERDMEEEKAAEIERLISMHQADLDGLQSQFERQEKEAELVSAVVQRLTEEVRALKQALKEREVQLAAAEKKAREDTALNATLSAHLDAANSELESALAREDELKSSLEESVSGVAGAEQRLEEMQESAEQQLEEMQHRHETELRAVRGISLSQAKGLEDRLKSAQEKAEEAQAQKDEETAAREAAEAAVEELQDQVDQLERDLIFLEDKYKQGVAKASAAAPAQAAKASELAKVKEALESKTQQAQAAKELVLQFMENEREKDFALKQLKREADLANERLEELERELEVTVAARIEDALDTPRGGRSKGDAEKKARERAQERSRFEEQLEGFRRESEQEITALRAELKGARSQLARVQKQSSVEVETKLAKQEMEFRKMIDERESERDGCLVRLGDLEEELKQEIAARESAGQELSSVQEQLLEWEQRATEMETAHAAALDTERETSRQKLEALYLDYERVRDEAQEKESERVSLAQQTEQLQAALADATSKGKLQAAKEDEAQTALAFNEDIVEELQAQQSRHEAELEALATEHATEVESLEDARAADAAEAQEEQERLEGEVASLREQVQELEEAVETRERENEDVRAQLAHLESANANAKQRLDEADAQLQQQQSADDVIAANADVIKALESERAAAASEALQRLEETDVLRARLQELQEEQEAALEKFREEAAANDEELTRVRQRLDDVERALEGSQEELRGAKLEEERLTSELTAAQGEQKDFRRKVEGLERALEASGTELRQSEEQQHELQQGLTGERQSRGEALRELQERESATSFVQRYFEERSGLDVQLFDLGRLSAKLEAAKRDASTLDGPEDVSSLQAEFSHLLTNFEAAVTATAATFGRPSCDGVDPSPQGPELAHGRGLAKKPVRGSGSGKGTPVPRALDLVGVDEAAGTALGDLNGRLSSAEHKADQLQLEIRQRVVRQMEWSESDGESSQSDEPQHQEVQERVSQMLRTFAREDDRGQ